MLISGADNKALITIIELKTTITKEAFVKNLK